MPLSSQTLASLTAYDFLSPARIVFGWGRWREVAALAAPLGRRAFIVPGSRTLAANGTLDELAELLARAGVEAVSLASIQHEPCVADVDAAAAALRAQGAGPGDLVLAIGGGSALDLGKAVAALATNTEGQSVRDYLEGVGRGLQIKSPPLPLMAVPTTAGTGSEATKNAVISSYDPPFKKSLRADLMMPRVVLVDPQLTVSIPPSTTAHTGLDAITQLIESYLSRKAKPLPQTLAVAGLRLALPAITEAVTDGTSRPAREAMSQAALLSGMALANSGLGMAHGVAAALGIHHKIAHGLACAIMLPVALAVNRSVCEPAMAALAREVGLAERSTDDAKAAEALIARIDDICRQLDVPTKLSTLGVKAADLAPLVHDARGNSMDGNPRSLNDDELGQILAERL